MNQLSNQYNEPIKGQQPLPVDTVEAQETASVSQTLTYTGKAAAGAVATVQTQFKGIAGIESGRIGSYWGNPENLVYSTDYRRGKAQIGALTETNGSAAAVIRDDEFNLELLFESLTTTVKRYVLKATDNTGAVLYGWIMGVAASSNAYTFDIFNARLDESAQNWVGTLASFDNTNVARIEIYRYDSSIAFGTGTTFTEEVAHPKEYSTGDPTSGKISMTGAINSLSNGQYFVDYFRGELIGKRADTTASETITYDVLKSTASGGTAANVNISELGGETLGDHGANVIDHGIQPLWEAKNMDGSALPNAVTEGQAARPASTLNGVPYAFLVNEDGSATPLIAESAAISAANGGSVGLMQAMEALSAQKTAVTSGDGTRPVTNLNGEQVMANYTWSTSSGRTEEVDPLDEHYILSILENTTNLAAATYYYPSASGKTMGNKNNVSLDYELSGGVTMTFEQRKSSSGSWKDITPSGYNLTDNTTGNASFVDVSGTIDWDNLHTGMWRVKIVTSDATNSVYLETKETAI